MGETVKGELDFSWEIIFRIGIIMNQLWTQIIAIRFDLQRELQTREDSLGVQLPNYISLQYKIYINLQDKITNEVSKDLHLGRLEV